MAGLGCFVDPINRAPSVVSITSIGSVLKNKAATLKITAYDPDSDSLTITWAVEHGACPGSTKERAAWPAPRQDVTPVNGGVQVDVDKTMTAGRFCAWAFATDRYGATSADSFTFDPESLPPQPQIDVVAPDSTEPYRLYSELVLTSDGSTNPDQDPLDNPLDFSWNLTRKPLGSTAVLLDSTGCTAPMGSTAGDLHCLPTDKPGQYEVELTATEAASDGNSPNKSMSVRRVFNVNPDELPSIVATSPSFGDGEIPVLNTVKFEVTRVDDDGDPLPAMAPNQLSFTWFLTGPDGKVQTLDNDLPWLSLGLVNYHLGDHVKLRVEVHDRNRDAGDRALLGCGDADFCNSPPGHLQRVTWNLLWSGG